jgi:hypothetical protein
LSYELTPAFSLLVQVQDNGSTILRSQATISISVLNLNEAPTISNQTFNVNANSANATIVGTVSATDSDAGQILTYSILSGNTNNAFSINASSGVLSVATSSALNYLTTPIFALVIKVQDNGTGTLSSQATITVNLISVSPCSATGNISYQVWNNIGAGSAVSVLTTNANYPDNPTTTTLVTSMRGTTNLADNFGARIAGYICPPATGSYVFWISSDDNGELWLSSNDQASNKKLIAYHTGTTYPSEWNKYTTQKSATINLVQGQTYYIEALMKENTSSDNFAVGWAKPGQATTGPSEIIPGSVLSPLATNTNKTPVINNQSFSVNENSSVGITIGTVVASDPNAEQKLTYSILSGNTNSAFAINTTTGVLSVANSSSLDFETTPSFNLVVKVTDNGTGNLNSQATVTVSLLNVNEVPVINNQTFSIAENTTIGSIVGTVVASDPDAGQTKTYSILSGNTNVAFAINTSTGVITVANSSALNFETVISFVLTVKVQDNGTGSLSSQAIVTINNLNINEPPVISNQVFSVDANSANGTVAGTISASDPDAGQILTYSIVSGNTNSAFSINSSTGVLTVATSSALNYTTTPSFTLVVKVQDNGSGTLSSQATATVNLVGPCSATGNISYQVWNNVTGTLVSSLTSYVNYPNNPSSTTLITSMKGTTNLGDNFGARIAGYICAPATGSYTFWISSDEDGELWLSTNNQEANKQLIAYHTGTTYPSEWNKYATQKSASINLIQGKSYYIEALMKENLYSDNFAVAWSKPGQSTVSPVEVIPGSVLSPIVIKSKEAMPDNLLTDNMDVKLSVYPNPLGNEVLNIKLENVTTEATLSIYSVSGILTYQEKILNSTDIQIDRGIFKSGIYFIKVFNDQFIINSKLIIN